MCLYYKSCKLYKLVTCCFPVIIRYHDQTVEPLEIHDNNYNNYALGSSMCTMWTLRMIWRQGLDFSSGVDETYCLPYILI